MYDRDQILEVLDGLAPLSLAAGWDNTGLLLEGRKAVKRVFLTIDLSEPVLAEALEWRADLVIAYHPPIFSGLKRLTRETPGGRVILDALTAGVSVYSPHTALDAAAGGMNDWLVEGLGGALQSMPIEPDPTLPEQGMGRKGALHEATTLQQLIPLLKEHLGLPALRVAVADALVDRPLRSFAVCPGAGGSMFAELSGVDLYLTGEMRHHDVLAKVAAGAVVVLTDHSNTERGYLPQYAERISAALPELELAVSQRDRDPLTVV